MRHARRGTLPRRKQMADPKAEKIEKKVEEAAVAKQDSGLSDTEVEKVVGGQTHGPTTGGAPQA